MLQCRSCKAENPERNHFCGVCGAALPSNSQEPTVLMSLGNAPGSSGSLEEGRFPAGTVLAERYRVIGLLGQGGMGEVYRASDLKLGQPVALKFLPVATARNKHLRERFHAEVRIARQVSHPNVCRVYDIGETEGSMFLSMEYVDGEDLRSLLRRIGRLPGDKAVEIARKLCAGLAAAHDKGVLHRDLKPANIMIDGPGQVLITDFGLAALAGQLDGAQVREGTPAYMAPEQLAGKEVSVRSDVYALGLVLHEMFTGKRAFENGSERNTPTGVSSSSKDIDPLVERVILRCLDKDPRKRPASALAVAAALPGGDPLAAALAAGETPTPAMVAASGEAGISVRAAGIWLALILVGLVGAVVLGEKTNVLRKTPFEKPPAVLEERAQNLIQSFGYADPPADRAYGFGVNDDYQDYAKRRKKPAEYRDWLAKGQPALIQFWYRQSPQSLRPINPEGDVDEDDPPQIHSGMVDLRLDPQGHLLGFDAVPPAVEEKPDSSRAPDWAALFDAAGLDMTRFTPTEPQTVPLAGFDARAAWTGSYAHAPDLPLRVEAAAWRGKPVFYRMTGPWSNQPAQNVPSSILENIRSVLYGFFIPYSFNARYFVVGPLAAFLAWRNFRAGRGDIRGASRLAMLVFGVQSLAWLCYEHNILEGPMFPRGDDLLTAGWLWIFYMALEPYVRRRWPQIIVTWSRVLAGGFRDPLVGGHLLAGIAFGIGFAIWNFSAQLALEHYGSLPQALFFYLLDARMAGFMLGYMPFEIQSVLIQVIQLLLLRVLLRRDWLMAAVWILYYPLLSFGTGDFAVSAHPVIGAVSSALRAGLPVAILLWFGVLPAVLSGFVTVMLSSLPLTTDLSVWYSGPTIAVVAVVLVLTAYAFHTAVAGRRLFKAGFLEPN
jgi:predicted Ser/Thr protein kinase